jgi:putative membrane protein
MTILTLLRTELRRLTATRLGVLSFIALMTVPLLYGGMYLWGNLDPYGKFGDVPAAVVVADAGTTSGGSTVNRGKDAADSLVHDGTFDWHVLSAAEAKRELANGGVDFVVTFPKHFSSDLASAGTTDPTRARLQLTTNDANSYLSSTIAGQVTTQVRDRIASQVGRTAASRFLVSLSTVRGKLSDAADGATTLADGAGSAASGAKRLASGTATLSSGARSAASGTPRSRPHSGRPPARPPPARRSRSGWPLTASPQRRSRGRWPCCSRAGRRSPAPPPPRSPSPPAPPRWRRVRAG